ncbi:MAG: DNA-processing protein DprA [Candidatus Aminicenantes bacterium]|nr:DNA-processing protein DprA [Candidatus Aminicenantes bacterium]
MENSLKYWVALNLTVGEDLRTANKIVGHFPSVKDVFKTTPKKLVSFGAKKNKAEALVSGKAEEEASAEIDRAASLGYSILTRDDEEYPERLREIFDPPCVLYCAGNAAVLKEPAVSLVGSRKPTPYGRSVADKLARELASCNIIVVSGLARGLDSAAHWGALKEGKTVAVLGSGLENCYPRENRGLFRKIIEKGAVISEFPLDSPPLALHFPRRNRIISGLSMAVVVIEATLKSGSLISAKLALEQNREVMAVPGNITSPLSRGTNWLIRSGAKSVGSWEDVVDELPSEIREACYLNKKECKEKKEKLLPKEKQIHDMLKIDTLMHVDEIVAQTGFSIPEIFSTLLSLEMRGLIIQRPGKYYQRRW